MATTLNSSDYADYIMFNLPYDYCGVELYSCKLRNFKRFEELANKYLIFSYDHYKNMGMKDLKPQDFLKIVVFNSMVTWDIRDIDLIEDKNISTQDRVYLLQHNEEISYKLESLVTKEMCEMFSYVLKEEPLFVVEDKGVDFYTKQKKFKYAFKLKDGTEINDGNFDLIRRMLLKINLLKEPKLYKNNVKDKILKEWEEKAIMAKNSKSDSLCLGDIANIITCNTNKTYEQLLDENIFQFYSDFHRVNNNFMALTTSIFKSVDGKYKGVNFARSIIKDLYKDSYSDIWVDSSEVVGNFK